MKPNSHYKMSKEAKTALALTKFNSLDDHSHWKEQIIDSELTAAIKPKREKGSRDQSGE